MSAPPSAMNGIDSFSTLDWLKGLAHGAIAAFGGFLLGALIAAIFALSASPPTWAPDMPYIATIGGFAFGFLAGVTRRVL